MTAPNMPPDDDLADRAAAYICGALPEDDCRRLEAEARRNPALRDELSRLRRVTDALLAQSPAMAPAPEVRDRLMARLSAAAPSRASAPSQPWKSWGQSPTASNGGAVFFAADAAFEPTAYPGVEVRRLFVDRAADRTSMVVRMAPGSSYPAHRHGGFEECFVLEGTLKVGADLVMRQGDYQAQTNGSVHELQSTDDGCLLLISSSLGDEFV